MIERRYTMNVAANNYMPLVKPFTTSVTRTATTTTNPLLSMPSTASIHMPQIPQLNAPPKPHLSSNLGAKLAGDVLVATGVTFCVSPFLTVVDKAIVQRAAGTHSLMSSAAESILTIAKNPVAFVKSPTFLIMWGVYAATYSTANSLKTISEHQEHFSQQKESNDFSVGKMGVFAGTTAVNSGVSMWKDKTYASMFGTSGAATVMPRITYGLWAARDCLVIGSSFVLPELVSEKLVDQANMEQENALRVSQLTVPIATQFIATPLQLLGLDFYNRPLASMGYGQAAVERTRFLTEGFGSVVAARVARIAPAYSIGGVLNTKLRDMWRERLVQNEEGGITTRERATRFARELFGDRQATV